MKQTSYTNTMKHTFNRLERYIVWKAHGEKCYWCGVPMSLQTLSIDHVIPESKEKDLESIKKDYGLPGNFVINGFCNWVPAHNNCNSKKSFGLFEPSPVFLAILSDIIKKSIKAQNSYVKLEKSNKIDDALGKLSGLMDKEIITEKDIIEHLGFKIFEDEQVEELGLDIPEGWKVEHVDKQENIITVSQGGRGGTTIIPPNEGVNPWWFCHHCGNHGPWSGSMCLTCGHFAPND